eukprot:GFUD01014260.1.p1 GENE.GFUD01014260.1~~GFUD01014260.1.p1  ORF type:complete len:451 (-),score=168.90 GFUD01014260.1:97-1398(-)
MALVAYDSNSDSDYSEDEEDVNERKTEVKLNPEKSKNNDDDQISDEEDFFDPKSNGIFEEEPDLISLIHQKLPNAKLKAVQQSFIDEAEDVTAIPTKKDYGEKLEEPPAKKKKRVGPVQIVLPALTDLKEDDEFKEPVKVQPSQTGSGLFSILPPPKNKMTRQNRSGVPTASPVISQSSHASSSQNLKPQGVRTVGLVPHRVANPVKPVNVKTKPSNDSDEDIDDDYLGVNSGSYFPAPPIPTTSKYKKVNPMPQPSHNPGIHINPTPSGNFPPSLPSNASFVSLNMADDASASYAGHQDLGPAVAPYPPPAPSYAASSSTNQLVDNEQALLRLAGKQNKLKEANDDGENGGLNIIDLNEDDMKGDPRVWLTKAMTEEQAPRPTGKGPKGLAKTRHQITYLAHQAKERDWELKQDWATARENRRASMNKYGFI